MKKSFLLLSAVLFLGLSSCGGEAPVHVHTFSEEYEYNGSSHWHPSTCGHPEEIDGLEDHIFTEWAIISETTEERHCTVCAYSETKDHVHGVDSNVWEHDDLYHWHPSTCGHESAISKEEHDFVETVLIAADFDHDGTTKHECRICHYSYEETVPQLEHSYSNIYSFDDNEHYYACTDPGFEYLKTGEEAHDFGDWVIIDHDTEERACSICHYVQSKNHVHSYDLEKWEKDETHHWHPSTCGHDDTVNKEFHRFGEWTIVSSSKEERTCQDCGYVESKDHIHTYDEDTYVFDENTHWHPDTCGHNTKLGEEEHDFTDWYLEASGTSIRRDCRVCDYYETQAHTHTYSEEWSTNYSYHWHADTCGHNTKIDYGQHTYGEIDVIEDATEYAAGSGTKTCSICGYTITVTIPQLPHTHTFDLDNWESDGSTHWHKPLCLHSDLKDSVANHTFGEWSLAPEGHYHRSCTVCGYVQNKTSDGSPIYNPDNTYVTFGEYPVGKLLLSSESEGFDSLPKDSLGYVTVDGEKYGKGSYFWYKVEPISWKAVHQYGEDKTLLFADYPLATSQFSYKDTATYLGELYYTYYNSEVRDWCNKFANKTLKAFSSIITPVAIYEDGVSYAMTDKVFVPSSGELSFCGYDSAAKRVATFCPIGTTNEYFIRNSSKTYANYIDSNGINKTQKLTSYSGIRPMVQVSLHKYSQEYAYDETQHWHESICSHSDLTTTKVDHTMGDWVTITPATDEYDGLEERYCTACHYREERTISYLLNSKFTFTLNEETNEYSVKCICNEEEITVPSTFRGIPVTGLDNNCFKQCTNTKIINLPQSIKHIGNYAFSKTQITEMTIPSTVENFGGTGCFENCAMLERLTVEIPLAKIPANFVSGCKKLRELNLASDYSELGSNCFNNCESLFTHYEAPDTLTKVGSYAFSGCKNLVSANLKNKLATLSENMFSFCSSLTTVDGIDSVTALSQYTFQYCKSLTSFTIPYGVQTLPNYTFSNCTALETVNIGDSLASIQTKAFEKCTSLSNINISPNNPNFASDHGVLYDAAKTKIAFYPSSLLTGVIDFLPDTLTDIGTMYSYSTITSITLPSAIQTLQGNAFYYCSQLAEVNFQEGLTYISRYAFGSCYSLTSIVLPNSVQTVYSGAFSNCRKLTTFYVGSGISSIYPDALSGCSSYVYPSDDNYTFFPTLDNQYEVIASLKAGTPTGALLLPDHAKKIAAGLFKGSAITSIESFGGLTAIPAGAFNGCNSLTEVTVPGTIQTVGESAFANCQNLVTFTLSEGIKTLERYILDYCNSLTTLNLARSVTSAAWITNQARSLATINFPGTKAQYYGSIYYRNTMFLRQSIATSYITCTDGTVVI